MPSRSIRGEVSGLAEALKALDGLSRSVRNQALRPAVREADRLVLQAARAAAPVGETGLLKMSLGEKVQAYRKSGVVVGITGPRTGTSGRGKGKKLTAFGRKAAALGVKPSKYAHLVEGGHLQVSHRPRQAVVGLVRPRPFLAPAFEAKKQELIGVIARRIGAELARLRK